MRILRSPSVPRDVGVAELSEKWWEAIEQVEAYATMGKSYLVRRHYNSSGIICDYITIHQGVDLWKRVVSVYRQGERLPFVPTYDGNRHHMAPRRLMTGLVQSTAGRPFLQQDR